MKWINWVNMFWKEMFLSKGLTLLRECARTEDCRCFFHGYFHVLMREEGIGDISLYLTELSIEMELFHCLFTVFFIL